MCLSQIRTVTDHLETNDGKVLNEDQIEDLKEVTKARKEQDVNLLIQLGVGWLLKIHITLTWTSTNCINLCE